MKGQEVREHNAELHNLYSSSSIIKIDATFESRNNGARVDVYC
jgi:hypothetical protein